MPCHGRAFASLAKSFKRTCGKLCTQYMPKLGATVIVLAEEQAGRNPDLYDLQPTIAVLRGKYHRRPRSTSRNGAIPVDSAERVCFVIMTRVAFFRFSRAS